MRKITTFFLLFVSVCSFAQYTDTFSDGDFTNNPTWSGNTDKFIVNSSQQLQLSASAVTSTAYLSTPSASINNASWQFYLKAGLLLTSGNYVNYYLVSNSADLSGSLNGYYVMVGNTNKEVALYKQSGTTKTKLVAGVASRLPTTGSTTEITVKVTRDAAGNWTLTSKLPTETAFVTEGTVTDATYFQSNYSGVYCSYSSTNSTKYAFDDITVTGDPYVDTTPPSITSYNLSGNKTLVVNFSEPVTLASATITVPAALGSYTQSMSGNTLTFTFTNAIPNFQTYVVSLLNVKDLAGNLLPKSDLSFGLFPTAFGDLTFNEIMADPSPKVGLPEVEYIELYNRRNFPISLSEWKFYYGSKAYPITSGQISANGYFLLCAAGSVSALSGYGTSATFSSFPALSGTGQLIYLTNDKDSLISSVNYSNAWYKSDFKSNGGWSLECIDSENLSGAANNWIASNDVSGGTPGRKNSTVGVVNDTIMPLITAVSFALSDTLTLQFNKSMQVYDLANSAHYQISNGITVTSVKTDFPQGRWAQLVLSATPQAGTIYQVAVKNLKDVNQNLLTQTMSFGLPDSCTYRDLVINEILSHPKSGGVTFVELYNRSKKIIDLKRLWLNRVKSTGGLDIGYPITSLGQQVLPGEYVVLTTSQKGVCDFYNCKDESKFVEMSSFVSIPNSSGNVLLTNRAGAVIDSVGYDEKRHDAMINDPVGVSFERVNPDWSSTDINNWHSCASDAGYATPGYKNSQYRELSDATIITKSFWLETESFTPDNDGVDDLLLIRYKMPDNGYSATLTVYDATGRKIKQLTNNTVLGSEGVLTWNGTTDSGKLANPGVYVLYVDAVSAAAGKREQQKIACVVAAK